MARPKSFDQEKAMLNAMLLFWKKGYEATSVKDLEHATGLKTSSLYNTFGGKEQLFLNILKHYSEMVIGGRMKRYLMQDDPIKSIREFYTTCFTDLPEGQEGIACLLVNTTSELAAHHEGVREIVIQNEEKLRDGFKNCVEKAIQQDRIPKHLDSDVLASQLLITLNGLLLSSKAVRDNEKMVETCEQSLGFILGKEAIAA